MSSEQQSCLRFSVEESIWFQKGQEVSELISIALDPDIQIYEQDQYVSIRGALLLTGEYQVNAEAEEDAEGDEYHPQARVVQEVEEREDGVCAMNHRFPVDITIPKNRIQSLDDIYVAIESFDYSVPTRGCLQLDAELSISGIYGHQQSSPSWEQEQEEMYEVEPNRDHEEAYASQNAQNLDHLYEQETEEQEEQEQQEQEAFEYEPMYRSANSDNEYEEDTYQYYTEEDEEEEILNQHEIDANVQYNYNADGEYAPFEVEARKAPVTEEEAPYNPADYIYQDQAEDAYAPLHSLHSSKYSQAEEETSNVVSLFDKRKQAVADANQNAYANYSDDDPRDENDLSLTKIFADDGGEDFTKLKICIVQQGESMDHIAERYDVSIQQLIRVNRLSTDDHVNEGQLLYIPVKASSKSQ